MSPPLYSEKDFCRAVGWMLRRLRKERGVSQERAAEGSGLSRQHLTRLERGRHMPTPYTLAALAEFYALTAGELLERIIERATYLLRKKNRS